MSRLFCCDAERCKRRPKRPVALSDDIIPQTPGKKPFALDVSPEKSKAAIGAERATSSKPKHLSELFGCEESVHVVGERCIKKRRPKAKTCKTTAAEKRSNADVFVGSVHETAAGHWQRHRESPKDAEKCMRCMFARHKDAWKKEMPWLSEKPAFQGGYWRLGCDVCAWYSRQRGPEKHEGRRGCNVRSCAFAPHDFIVRARPLSSPTA